MLIIASLMGLLATKSTATEPATPPAPLAIESQVKQVEKPKMDVIRATAASCME